jgi:hypothetical protein
LKELHFDRARGADKVLLENADRLLTILHANRDIVKMITMDIPRLPGKAQRDPFAEAFVGPLSGYLSAYQEQGVLRKVDPDTAATVLYGTLRSYFIENYIGAGKAPEPLLDGRFTQAAVTIFLNGVRADATPSPAPPPRKRAR